MARYCPKCGKISSSINILGDFCLEHGLEQKFSFLPPKIKFFYCTSCKKIKIFSKEEKKILWVEKESKEFFDFLFQKLKIFKELNIKHAYLKNNILHFQIENLYHSIHLKLIFSPSFCEQCKRKNSRGFKSIIQLRGPKEKIQEFKKFLSKNFSFYDIFIIKEEMLKEGENLFVSEKEKLLQIFSEKKIKFLRTSKLVGQRRDGKKIYLDTFLIRL